MSIICAIQDISFLIASVLAIALVLVWFLSLFFYWSLSEIQKDNFSSVLKYWFYTDLGFWGILFISNLFTPGYGC